MQTLKMFYAVALNGIPQYEAIMHWDNTPTFQDYLAYLMSELCRTGHRMMVVGQNIQSLTIILVGDHSHSRLIAVHEDDTQGIVYILRDDGTTPALDKRYEPVSAVTFTRLTEADYVSVRHTLELEYYRNDRLSDEAVRAAELFGPVTRVSESPMFGKPN